MQVAGLLAISIGLGIVYLPLGLIALGASAVLIGLSIEKSK